MIVEPQAEDKAEIGTKLKLMLRVQAGGGASIVTHGVSLQIGGGDVSGRAVGDGHALQEVREIKEADHAFSGPVIADIQLGVFEIAAESEGVLALVPGGVGRGHEAVLKDARPCALGVAALAEVHTCV